jgi:dTDP-4-amino-4,6-dideoxygalactose transaminase
MSIRKESYVASDLAIKGGAKVRQTSMPSRMAFGETEFLAVKEVFEHYKAKDVDFGYEGTYEKQLTDDYVKYLGFDGYADAVSSGTAALYVAFASLRLPPGSHVIVPPITGDPGPVNALILNQLVPVLADSMPGSYNMGVEQFEQRITSETKAVLVVHAAGKAGPIQPLVDLAKSKGIFVVEDCSQAHGARIDGRCVGTFGDVAASSTMYRKNLATGGCGGLVYCRDLERYRLVRACADRGKPFWKPGFDAKDPTGFMFPALNFNLDELSCAIGVKTLAKLDKTNQRRFAWVQKFTDALGQHSEVCSAYKLTSDDAPFFLPIFVDAEKLSCSKLEFANAIHAEGIDINPEYKYLVREWPWVQPYLVDSFVSENALDCRNRSFNILFNESYGQTEVDDIISIILKVESVFKK